MSERQIQIVWEYDFPHSERSIMQALAFYADEDGANINPSVDEIAWRTGYAKRNVQLILAALKASGVLIIERKATNRYPAEYRIDWSAATPKSSYDSAKYYLLQSDERRGDESAQQRQTKAKVTEGHLYLLHATGTDRYKIGITRQLTSRIRAIASQSPYPIQFVAHYPSGDIWSDEQFWHKHFADRRVHGEWFELGEQDVEVFKTHAIAQGGES